MLVINIRSICDVMLVKNVWLDLHVSSVLELDIHGHGAYPELSLPYLPGVHPPTAAPVIRQMLLLSLSLLFDKKWLQGAS